MATKYIQLGDVLVKRARVVGARNVPADSPAAHKDSKNCVRLELERPEQVISINPLGEETLEDLWQKVTDHLNGVEPKAAPSTEPPAGDGGPSAAVDEAPSAEDDEPSPEAAAEAEAAEALAQ